MQVPSFPARQARTHYRHELRTLTYVTLDEGNAGIIRNLSHEGVSVQAVGRLHREHLVRLRFELRFPRLRVEAWGQVSWTHPSGQCGIRFVDLPARTSHQVDEWIFSNFLDSLAREAVHPRSIFGPSVVSIAPEENDGLILSVPPRPAIRVETGVSRLDNGRVPQRESDFSAAARDSDPQLNWLSQPLSARTFAWMVDSLVVIAALLLFALIFLSIAHELPPWRLTVSAALTAAVIVAATYRTLFGVFGGPSLGTRLARDAADCEKEESDATGRFR